MAIFVTILLLIGVAVVGFAVRHWLNGRLSPLKDHSKKDEELNPDGVEIVVQKTPHERRLKLALPDLSSIQIHSPVVPMKSSIRSALKELRSRQMVQSLCSKFESRMKFSSDIEITANAAKNSTETVQLLQPTRARRRDVRDATVSPVLLASEVAKETEVTANARSNNLNKFLRSYASNLDNAISTERRMDMATDAISAERRIVMSTDAEDDIEQPVLAQTEVITTPSNDAFADSGESGMKLELDLQTLRLEAEYSNQCDSGSDEEVAVLVDATDCGPVVDESFGESDEGNNIDVKHEASTKPSRAFTITDWKISDITKLSDSNPESCSDPPAKAALDLFKQQVPSNRRARTIATLNF